MEAFKKDAVVPDVVDAAPPKKLTLKYGGKEIAIGAVCTPTQVQSPPEVDWEADPAAFYTLVMNDPDAPSRSDPKFGEWHHWLVTNIPGKDISKGDVMSEYVGAGPPKDTGLHRYVFMVYKQSGKQTFEGLGKLTNKSMDNRAKQKMREFCSKHKLSECVAGTFFQAEYDDYVPKLYKQLGA